MSIAGIVLAAGRSRRMGAPKALLELDGESFLARAARALRAGGCAEVVVVVGPQADADAREIAAAARQAGARTVVNALAGAEQIDSLRVGLRALTADAEAAVVTPVDVPRIAPATVQALIESFRRRGAPVVLPTRGGRHGHPVLFARALFPELLADPLPEGARSVVRAHAADLAEVPVDDAGILLDVDTPADYRRLRQQEP